METQEQKKQRTEAAITLLKLSNTKASEETLKKIETLERRAKMSVTEQLEDMANHQDPYANSKMRQSFPTIKNVVAMKGHILIIVDEGYAMKLAMDEAVNVLGPLEEPQKLLEYAESHRNKTTLLSIGKFMNNLSDLLYLAKNHPEMFGSDSGGGQLKDFLDASKAAIKEAHQYLIKNFGNGIGDVPRDVMGFHTPEIKDLKEFASILGEDWENELTPEQRFNLHGILLK